MRFGRLAPLSKRQEETRLKQFSIKGYKRWVDPFPAVHGTEPEKRVYQALALRGVRFYFLNDIATNIPELDIYKEYQADFILPDYKIIIEVQGAYWHSKPDAIASDALKFALYEATGYTPLAWWDYDIISDVNKLFASDPRLAALQVSGANAGELTPLKRTKVDTSQGIRTLNRKRAQRGSYKKAPTRFGRRKPTSNSYMSGL